MLITQEELLRRLESEKNLINRLNISDKETNDRLIKKAEESKAVIINTLASSDSDANIALAMGADVYDIKDAKVSRQNDEDLSNKVKYTKERLYDLAIEKTCKGLGLLSDEKLENADLDKLTKAILATSRVAERMSNRESAGFSNNIQITFNAPRARKEADYRVIDVS